jgi:hypothetical protein
MHTLIEHKSAQSNHVLGNSGASLAFSLYFYPTNLEHHGGFDFVLLFVGMLQRCMSLDVDVSLVALLDDVAAALVHGERCLSLKLMIKGARAMTCSGRWQGGGKQ